MYKFVFVILHYVNIEDTHECIESIKNLNYENREIVIVDNCSPNGSGKKLEEEYKNEKAIYVILNNKNLGFAKGNNEGFKYAKNILKADFICQINNDTIIEDENFIEKIISYYKKQKYYMAGPDVISLIDHKHQNPAIKHQTFTETVKLTIENVIRLFGYWSGSIEHIDNIYINRRKRKIKQEIINNDKDIKKVSDYALNGACWIYSPDYINEFNGMYSKTYMYGEELIMFYICKELGLNYVYIEDTYIIHKEGSSTKKVFNSKEKGIFFFSHATKSSFLLLWIMIRKNNKKYLRKQLENN